MMGSEGIKNTSLLLPEREETSQLNPVPVRNAVSSVKRSNDFSHHTRLSFKPIRLGDLTREWLEAENEPLKKFSEYEETKDSDTDTENDDKKAIDGLESALQGFHIATPKKPPGDIHDLGVNWLDTPDKVPPVQTGTICAATPKIVCATNQEFATPYNVKVIKNAKSVNKPKIQFSMNSKELLQTPLNPNVKRDQRNTQSLKKLTAPQAMSVCKNTSSDAALDRVANDTVKSNQNHNNILHDKNKENAPKNVQFSSLATELRDEISKEIKVKNVNYVILNQLGKGGSSVVYHCYNPKTKTEWAIKKVNLGSESTAVGYINEVKVLERLQKCDRIIKMFDYELIESEKLLLVVLERGGLDLSKILRDLSNTNKHLPMHMLIFYWMEMLYAVKQIHENGIIHSDLKPGNFLQAEGALKLIDFGIASCVQEDMTSVVKNVPVGSFNYISPEALTNDSSNNSGSPTFAKPTFKVSYRSDVWSLGCILYQLVYRRTPFQHIGHMWGKLSAIVNPKHRIDYPVVDWIPSRIVNTIKKCLQYDMRARPSVDELIKEYEHIYKD